MIFLQLESMPYDPEYFSMINDVFKDSSIGHFYRGFTILGATEKKIHFTLVRITFAFFSSSFIVLLIIRYN